MSLQKQQQILTSCIEAVVISHSGIYSVNCVHIACGSVNITVLGLCQIFMKGFYCFFFNDAFHFGARQKIQNSILHQVLYV